MAQRSLTKEQQNKEGYEQPYKDRMETFAGFAMDFKSVNTFDETLEQREAFFEEL